MIYYGLKVMAPSIFLPCAMVITSAVSMVVGSWGSAGTLGLALMGISQALGIPVPLTAGAIISGAYVGDQLSPLSDSTNLTGAVIGVSVFEHVRFLSPVVGCSYLLALTGYFLAGLHYRSGTAETIAENTGAFLSSISSAFSLSPLLFLPMILLIFCILRRVPAILGISAGILSAGVLGALMQGSGTFGVESVLTRKAMPAQPATAWSTAF
jgi:NhaC family Na+:H+ antiporter